MCYLLFFFQIYQSSAFPSLTPGFHPSLPQFGIATFFITLCCSFSTSTCMLNLLPTSTGTETSSCPISSSSYLNWYNDTFPLFPLLPTSTCLATPSHPVSSPTYLNRHGDTLSPLLPTSTGMTTTPSHPISFPFYFNRYDVTLSPSLLSFLPQQAWRHPFTQSLPQQVE